jgi:hypothetical protein
MSGTLLPRETRKESISEKKIEFKDEYTAR